MSTTELATALQPTASVSFNDGEQVRKRFLYVDPNSDDPFVQEQPTAFIMKLYEMINGAPDEVIAWTPEGDAFIIGADLITLEKHTLPRFFRHNRFQSFVRQLNFYSFRKINRERTMWVYKHDLFHRDRPEDLVKLRRRTCPTVDGRRQGSSQIEAKATNATPTERNSSSDEFRQAPVVTCSEKKRQISVITRKNSADTIVKRPSINGGRSPTSVDVCIANPVPLTESEDSDDQRTESVSTHGKAEDQAMIVLKIASQLAQHVRDPKNESRVSGLVTPTFGASRSSSISSGTLLTYDDEREKIADGYDHVQDAEFMCSTNHIDSNENSGRNNHPPKPRGDVTPLQQALAEDTLGKLLNMLDYGTRMKLRASADVACFCMTTIPSCSDSAVLSSIRLLLTSFSSVASDFRTYRSALSPVLATRKGISDEDFFYQMWLHEESCYETFRSFTVFAVNCMQSILRAIEGVSAAKLIDNQKHITSLQRTISVWQNSSSGMI